MPALLHGTRDASLAAGTHPMPSRDEILAALERTADEAFAIGVAWHVLAAIAVVALLAGWRPPRRVAASLLSIPLASVSGVAWVSGNPFSGVVFAILAASLVVLALRGPGGEPVAVARPVWVAAFGLSLVALGWAYPHFLAGRGLIARLVGAPLGVLPCPTLLATIGLALIGAGSDRRAWRLLLAAAGAYYGVTGVFQLGVWIDAPLVAGAVALAAYQPVPHRGERPSWRPHAPDRHAPDRHVPAAR
jgi:hypothetical protein